MRRADHIPLQGDLDLQTDRPPRQRRAQPQVQHIQGQTIAICGLAGQRRTTRIHHHVPGHHHRLGCVGSTGLSALAGDTVHRIVVHVMRGLFTAGGGEGVS